MDARARKRKRTAAEESSAATEHDVRFPLFCRDAFTVLCCTNPWSRWLYRTRDPHPTLGEVLSWRLDTSSTLCRGHRQAISQPG